MFFFKYMKHYIGKFDAKKDKYTYTEKHDMYRGVGFLLVVFVAVVIYFLININH